MTARECVDHLAELNEQIDKKLKLVSFMRSSLTSISAPPTDAEYVSHTKNVHAMQDTVAAIVDTEKEVDAMIDERVELRQRLVRAIAKLDDAVETYYVSKKYIECVSCREIAETENYSTRRVEQIVKAGMDHLDLIFQKDFA